MQKGSFVFKFFLRNANNLSSIFQLSACATSTRKANGGQIKLFSYPTSDNGGSFLFYCTGVILNYPYDENKL